MNLASIRIPPRISLATFFVLLAGVFSCGTNEESRLDLTRPLAQERIEHSAQLPRVTRPAFDTRDPGEVIQAFHAALVGRDPWLYARLLSPNFEYFPRPEDVLELPWMDGYSWARDEELLMVGNMFDPTYSGAEWPVESIQAFMTIDSTEEIGPGRLRVTLHMEGAVITGIDGWVIDTRLVFELDETAGDWSIERITELDPLPAPAGKARTEESSWALVKALYRSVY
jgi:hypothetical protein